MTLLKKAIKSRRGIALELAISTLLMVFALCSLLLTLSMFTIELGKNGSDNFENRTEIDSIGEDFVASLKNENTVFNKESYEKYAVTVSQSGNVYTMTAKLTDKETKNNHSQFLKVQVEYFPEYLNYRITRWAYLDN